MDKNKLANPSPGADTSSDNHDSACGSPRVSAALNRTPQRGCLQRSDSVTQQHYTEVPKRGFPGRVSTWESFVVSALLAPLNKCSRYHDENYYQSDLEAVIPRPDGTVICIQS